MNALATGTAGLVAGLGPEATIDYYRRLLAAWKARRPGSAPSLLLDSLDVQRVLHLAGNDRSALVDYLLQSLTRLHAAGATFAAITANTPHTVFDDLAPRSPLPLISIVESCANEAVRRNLHRLLILGARVTMQGTFYPAAFRARGLEVIAPDETDVTWIHDDYLRLVAGDFTDARRDRFTAFIEGAQRDTGIDGVILGGTELPILLRASEVAGVPLLDTTGIHVEAIIGRLLEETTPNTTSA